MVTLHPAWRMTDLKAPLGCLREHCEALGKAINRDLSLSGSWLEGRFEKSSLSAEQSRAPGHQSNAPCQENPTGTGSLEGDSQHGANVQINAD